MTTSKEQHDNLALRLPYPITVNHYWLYHGTKKFLSPRANKFRLDVKKVVDSMQSELRDKKALLEVIIYINPPDRRGRDLDNLFKSLFDALQAADVFKDDKQIKVIVAAMRVTPDKVKGGYTDVLIRELGERLNAKKETETDSTEVSDTQEDPSS